MNADASVRFFDAQFQRQVRESDRALNPFEQRALPHLRGKVLDYGCGMGNLALAAARRGCCVVALDASHTAIEHLRQVARAESLAITATEADLRTHQVCDDYDAVACIGLLMVFGCPTALAQLHQLQAHVRPGGVAVVNVLVQGTTYLGMFDPSTLSVRAGRDAQALCRLGDPLRRVPGFPRRQRDDQVLRHRHRPQACGARRGLSRYPQRSIMSCSHSADWPCASARPGGS